MGSVPLLLLQGDWLALLCALPVLSIVAIQTLATFSPGTFKDKLQYFGPLATSLEYAAEIGSYESKHVATIPHAEVDCAIRAIYRLCAVKIVLLVIMIGVSVWRLFLPLLMGTMVHYSKLLGSHIHKSFHDEGVGALLKTIKDANQAAEGHAEGLKAAAADERQYAE